MFPSLQRQAIPIVIAVAFFVSGFFTVANLLTLTSREIVLGLAAGAVGGLSVLLTVFWNERHSEHSSAC